MEKTVNHRCILIVDDEPGVLTSLTRMLAGEDYAVITAPGGEEGLALLAQQKVQLVISDEKMPGMSGTEFLAQVRRRHPAVIRIMLTGKPSVDAAMQAVNKGEIYRFFTKPWDQDQLIVAIRHGIEKHEMDEENRMLLRTIKKQRIERKVLEQQYPGITNVIRDADNSIIAEDVSPDEIEELKQWCREQTMDEMKK
jgi:two-component system, probable response regulator PhcQ